MKLVLKGAMVVAVLALLLLAAPSAYANACVSNATGNWNAADTWTACGGVVPTSADTVEINDDFIVTVNISNAVAASVQVGGDPGPLTGTLVFNSGSHLTVSGIITLGGIDTTEDGTIDMTNGGTLTVLGLADGPGANTKTFTPGTGSVELTATNNLPATIFASFNNLTITAGTTTLDGVLDVNGTLTQTGGDIDVGVFTLTVHGTHNAGTRTVSGAGDYTLSSGATLLSGHTGGVAGNITTTTQTLSTAANYTFNGSSAQVTSAAMPATVNNLTINNAAGVTLSRNTATSGTLIVTAGTFTVGAFTYSVTGATTVSGTLLITSTTGAKTFTGDVTINSGGTWNETANAAISFGGSLQNDGTFTAGTGVHTFTGTAKTISGANAIAIPSLTISGTTTNNGTLSVSTTLAGASTLTNGTNATLNFGGSSITPPLTATATGNTVNYNLAGAQTVQRTTYYNLKLSGSGSKTTTTVTVNGTLSMQGTATASTAPTYGATATLEYKGSAAQTSGPELLATMAAGRTVIINNAAGVTLGANATVNGNLTFTIGNVATGALTLYIGSGGAVSRTSGHVVGNFKKFIATGATSTTIEVGDASNYTPVLVSFASVTTAGDLTASVAPVEHANIGTSTIDATKNVNRNWTLTNSGIVFTTYSATFTFVAGDVDASANTSTFSVGRYRGGSWAYPTVGTKTTTSTQATGLSAFGDFQIGTITTTTYTISGHIQNASSIAISGVTVTLSGGQAGTTTTDTSGNYSFAGLPSTNNYTVTPSLTNYTFSAASRTYNALAANQPTADFTGTSTVTYTISGHIQNGNAAAISGITLTLSGGQAGTTTTDASGNYSFASLPSTNNYTLTPSLTNYTFTATSRTYNGLAANQTAADFLATAISGQASSLGAAASFAVLAGTTITSTGLTVVSGNVGVSPGTAVTGFPPGVIQNGAIYSGSGSLAGPAEASALTAYNDLKGQTCVPANNLSGKILGVTTGAVTLVPGVYCFDTSAQLTTTLTLNDGGDPNAIFIFQIGTTLTTASSAQVVMSSSGRGPNVYWQIGTSATIGTGTALRGNIIANTSITMTTSASTTGRLFAIGGAVTMDTNNVDALPGSAPPNVTLSASVSPTGTVQPRTDLVYTIAFSNGGAGQASSLVITDPIPANTDFKLGSVTTSLGTTGLTTTLAYSNNGGLSWTYTPLSTAGGAPAGYDRSVTHVRWSFGASLSQASPNNTGSVGLTARIR